MKALLFKEFRENGKWGLLAFLIVVVWAYIRLAVGETNALLQVNEVLFLMAPIAGLALGIAQFVFECRPDNWAFVVHRPISRGAIFAGKAIAGLSLLFTALLLPIVLSAIVANRSGHTPMPFNWRMMLPGLATSISAAGWYFAGILLTLHRARWYGSRVLPIGMAFLGSAWVVLVPDLWLALLGVMLMIPCLAAAAWGVFSNGDAAPRTLVTRLGLAASSGVSSLFLFLLVGQVAAQIDLVSVEKFFQIEKTGRFVVVNLRQDSTGASRTVTDLDGHPLPEYANLDQDPEARDRWTNRMAPLIEDSWIDWPMSVGVTGYRALSSFMCRLDGAFPKTSCPQISAWYNIDRRIIQLYSKATRHPAGTIGPDGFSPAGSVAKGEFPGKPLNISQQNRVHTLAFPSAVYWMDLDQQRIHKIFSASADDPVLSAADFDIPGSPLRAAIMTQSRLHIIDPTGKSPLQFSGRLDFDHTLFSGAGIINVPGTGRILANIWWERDEDKTFPSFEFTPDGTLVKMTEIPLPQPMLFNHSVSRATLMGIATPLISVPLYRPLRFERNFHFHRMMGPDWNYFLTCMVVSAILSALVTLILARRFGFSLRRAIAWTFTACILGPAVIIIFLTLNDFPVWLRCASCHRLRIADELLCKHCGSLHAPPELDGREIFEPCSAM